MRGVCVCVCGVCMCVCVWCVWGGVCVGCVCVHTCRERNIDFKELAHSRLEILHVVDVTILSREAFCRQNSFLFG